MLTSYWYNTKASSIDSGQRLQRRYLCWGGFVSKTPRLPSTQLHGELQGVWLLSTPTLQLSRVYLPSTCDITHVITYTRPSSLLFYFWVRGRGRPGDEANWCAYRTSKCVSYLSPYAHHMCVMHTFLFTVIVYC